MKILIIEDEYHAAKRLQKLIQELIPDGHILAVLESVEDSIEWFNKNSAPDIIFLDIQLADGLSFDIIKKARVEAPVIFTTAFDEYAIKAFKINSVDYLLKPIDKKELRTAIEKFRRIHLDRTAVVLNETKLQNLLSNLTRPNYVRRFLIKRGQQLLYISVSEVAYFYSENAISYLLSIKGKKHNVDYTMEELEEMLDSEQFFRINRKLIVKIDAVKKVSPYFNHRLKLALSPDSDLDAIVSRDRVKNFTAWLGA